MKTEDNNKSSKVFNAFDLAEMVTKKYQVRIKQIGIMLILICSKLLKAS